MRDPRASVGRQELRYFGVVTASVSHELKNVLAILNENTGLLQDYLAMARQGRTLELDRVQKVCETMARQIDRGNAIVRRVNRFAHSADNALAEVDLHELVAMVIALFSRTAAVRGVRVETASGGQGPRVTIHVFTLETLLGGLLDRLAGAGPGVVTLEVRCAATGPEIVMRGPAGSRSGVEEYLAGNDGVSLLAVLGADAGFGGNNGELIIRLPGDDVARGGAQ